MSTELFIEGRAAEPAPLSAWRVADEVLRRYALGALLDLEALSAGMLNQNLRAVTARGGYFLKGYRYSDPAPIAREHALLAFAVDRGVPAVAPLAAPGGATFLRAGGRFWAVFPLITDRQVEAAEVTPAMAESLGRTLGITHTALAQYPAIEAARFPLKMLWDSRQASDEIAWYEGEIARRPVLDPFDQHALASFSYRRTLLVGGVPPPAAFVDLPAQLLHGDYHERNVFFDAAGNVSGVIDWELAARGPRAWEFIRTLDFALPLPEDFASGGERLRAFLRGYAAVAPLTVEECQAMPELYWAARVHSLWIYEEHYRKGSARTDRLAMEDISRLEWWARNRAALARVLADTVAHAPRTGIVTRPE
jgi:Ser/Thr protein kinase RdoA (MazF antagonist)